MNMNIISGIKKAALCGMKEFCPNLKKTAIQAGKTMQKQQIETIFKSGNGKIITTDPLFIFFHYPNQIKTP